MKRVSLTQYLVEQQREHGRIPNSNVRILDRGDQGEAGQHRERDPEGGGDALVGGVHRAVLKINWRGKPDAKALAALIDNAAAKPDHVLRRFAW